MEPTKTCAYMNISKPTYIPKCIYKNIGYLPITRSKLITQGRLLFQEAYTLKNKDKPRGRLSPTSQGGTLHKKTKILNLYIDKYITLMRSQPLDG